MTMKKDYPSPFYSAKVQAYIIIYDKLKSIRLKNGLFSPQYTQQVNEEVAKIKKRFFSSISRVRQNEGLKKLCDKDPEFAKKWNEVCLHNSYYKTIAKEQKLRKKIIENEKQSENSSN